MVTDSALEEFGNLIEMRMICICVVTRCERCNANCANCQNPVIDLKKCNEICALDLK